MSNTYHLLDMGCDLAALRFKHECIVGYYRGGSLVSTAYGNDPTWQRRLLINLKDTPDACALILSGQLVPTTTHCMSNALKQYLGIFNSD